MGLIFLFKKQFICMVDIFIIVVMLFSLFVGFCGLKVGVNLSRTHVHSKIV
jgi:hypothetical protein